MFSGCTWYPAVTGMPICRAIRQACWQNRNGVYRCTTSTPRNAARNRVSLGSANCICCFLATQLTNGT